MKSRLSKETHEDTTKWGNQTFSTPFECHCLLNLLLLAACLQYQTRFLPLLFYGGELLTWLINWQSTANVNPSQGHHNAQKSRKLIFGKKVCGQFFLRLAGVKG